MVFATQVFAAHPNLLSPGEYAERIDNADELLESFLEGFHDENTAVQLQLLTAIVKLFLKRPTETQELVQQVSTALKSSPIVPIVLCYLYRGSIQTTDPIRFSFF